MNLNVIDINKKWVIACSGGADSMALLDMCFKFKMDIVVVNINYKSRDTSDRDMNCVIDYCKSNNIEYYVKVRNEEVVGNFEAWAREYRYNYFNEIINLTNSSGVIVAHHQDDVLETYMMQLLRNNYVEYFGMNTNTNIFNINVIRPLLDYTKQDLLEYCSNNNVHYEDDETNFDNKYVRNNIRNTILNNITKIQRKELLDSINELNNELMKQNNEVNKFIEANNFELDNIIKQKYIKQIIFNIIKNKCGYIQLTNRFLDEIVKIVTKNKNFEIKLNSDYILYDNYGVLDTYKYNGNNFEYVLEKVEYIKTDHFQLLDNGNLIESITLKEEDFPIKIRSAYKDDKIKLRIGTKKINRFFIDNKIDKKFRNKWLVIENSVGNVVFISGIGCDIYHFSYQPSFFVVK